MPFLFISTCLISIVCTLFFITVDLVESEYSGAKIREYSGNSLKPCQDYSERDSYLTTDSESENEKVKPKHVIQKDVHA